MAIRLKPRSALQRSGWVPIPSNRSILVSVADGPALAIIEPLLASLRRERISLLFIPGDRQVKQELITRFGDAAVIDAPWNNRVSSVIFLLMSRARLLIGAGRIDALPKRLVREAYLMGIGVAFIAGDKSDAEMPDATRLTAVDMWLAQSAAAGAALQVRGVAPDRIVLAPMSEPASLDLQSATMKRLNFLLARRPPARNPLQALVAGWLDKPAGRRLLKLRAERIETLGDLSVTLNHPHTILCLGNGPSSEDPALVQQSHDCLFRVNHRWLKRGLYADPQVVFTGQKRTLFTLRSRPIFAFQTRRAEALLVTHQIFNPLCRHMRFVTLERLQILGQLDWDGVRPTNGATMLAVAVALKPKRLVISGIDLFEDPAGAYPGDTQTPNDYVVVHERTSELDFILDTLERFEGELVILSKPLAEKWAARSSDGRKSRQLPE